MPRAQRHKCSIMFSVMVFMELGFLVSIAKSETLQVDVVLRKGMVYDGSGAPGQIADVAIKKRRIAAVGVNLDVVADRELDCSGLVIAPGWIDLHTHSDDAVLEPDTRFGVGYIMQGCTTMVTGNCGSGPIDVKKYLEQIDQYGCGPNVAHLIPHGRLRTEVLQKEARDPNEEELQKMRELADRAMRDGAWGMSTGLIYVPGTFSKTEELIEISKIVSEHGGIYVSHIRNEGSQLIDSIEEALRIGREAKLPVHVSHFKASGKSAWGTLRVAAERIEQAQREGQTVTADQYPYAASSTSLEATLLPAWSREGGQKAIEARLKDETQRGKIREAVKKKLEDSQRIQIAAYAPQRRWVGKSIDEIAQAEKREPVDVALEMQGRGGAKVVNFGMQESDVRLAMSYPWVATASDGSSRIPNADQPHPRSYGTFARKIGFYAIQEKELSLEQAIYSSSGLPAKILGITDRGLLKPELAADIVVFDPKAYRDQATYEQPTRVAVGVRYVFINGVPAVDEGIPTGALAGKVLRKKKS